MRHFIPFVCLVAVLLAACKNGEPELKIKVEPSVITCPDTGGDYEIEVTAANPWTATASKSWIKLTPASGEGGTSTVRIKISANKESAESTGKITFTDGENTTELPVTRAAKAPARLTIVSETEINAPRDGGEYTIQVESNIRWSAASNVSWAKVSKGVSQNNDNVTVTVDAATAPEETTAVITIAPYGEGKDAGEHTVTVTRGGTDATSMSVDPTKIDASSEGGNFTVNVSTTAKWRVWTTWDVDWFKLSNTEGDGDGSFGVTVDPATSTGDMTGIITIEEVRTDNYTPVVSQVTVTRKGKAAASLSVSPMKIDAPATGGEYTVQIKSNYPWTATLVGAKYFSISVNKGDGDATMIVTVKPATEEKEETGSITIQSTFGGEQAHINIKRKGKLSPEQILSVDPQTIDAPYEGGKVKVNVKCKGKWTAETKNENVARIETWNSIRNKVSGNGNGSFEIKIYSASDQQSSAIITVKSEDVSVDITINRPALPESKYQKKPFSISKSKQVYFSPGNLQYMASENKWRFANQQFQCVARDNVYNDSGVRSKTFSTSSTYDGWQDLFGWGTGANPTLISDNDDLYSTFTDWGHNAIYYGSTLYRVDSWRTLSSDETSYLLKREKDGKSLSGIATVNGVWGLVLLPDDWVFSSAKSFTGGILNDWGINKYNLSQWQNMEAAGAVFLPNAGFEHNTVWSGLDGTYWLSAATRYLRFDVDNVDVFRGAQVSSRRSVRLVQDIK